jgi:hypothetical protein
MSEDLPAAGGLPNSIAPHSARHTMHLPPKRSDGLTPADSLRPYALAVLVGLSLGLLVLSLVGVLLMGEGL